MADAQCQLSPTLRVRQPEKQGEMHEVGINIGGKVEVKRRVEGRGERRMEKREEDVSFFPAFPLPPPISLYFVVSILRSLEQSLGRLHTKITTMHHSISFVLFY